MQILFRSGDLEETDWHVAASRHLELYSPALLSGNEWTPCCRVRKEVAEPDCRGIPTSSVDTLPSGWWLDRLAKI